LNLGYLEYEAGVLTHWAGTFGQILWRDRHTAVSFKMRVKRVITNSSDAWVMNNISLKTGSELHRLCNVNDELERMKEEVVVACLMCRPTICLERLIHLSKDIVWPEMSTRDVSNAALER
jgi:hypothetical protein